jgi:hypothetical protein
MKTLNLREVAAGAAAQRITTQASAQIFLPMTGHM